MSLVRLDRGLGLRMSQFAWATDCGEFVPTWATRSKQLTRARAVRETRKTYDSAIICFGSI